MTLITYIEYKSQQKEDGWNKGTNIHRDVGVCSLVTVKANAQTAAQVHGNFAKLQASGTIEPQAEVRVTRHAEVWDLDVCGVERLDGAAPRLVTDIDRSAALEDLATPDGDRVGTNRAGGDDGNALTARCAVDCCLDRGAVVRSRVQLCRACNVSCQ